jgi:hypothetical protein
MKKKIVPQGQLESPEWFFMWAKGTPYITSVCGWTKRQVIAQIESDMQERWKTIYGRGGRVKQCTVSLRR